MERISKLLIDLNKYLDIEKVIVEGVNAPVTRNELLKRVNLREWYKQNYPHDTWAINECKSDITFFDVVDGMRENMIDFYDITGVSDSIFRERVFNGICKCSAMSYDILYHLWLIG